MTRPPVDPRWPQNPNLEALQEARLTRCARCYEDADGEKGRPMVGLLTPDYPTESQGIALIQTLARTRVLIRLRLCVPCYTEAMAAG